MKRRFIPIIVCGLLVVPLAACGQNQSRAAEVNTPAADRVIEQAAPTPSQPNSAPTAAPAFDLATNVNATGEVQASQEADLFFAVAGTVADIFVAEGNTVTAGQTLAVLDTRPFDQRIRQAEAAVAEAQARQAALSDGPRAADVAAARAQIAEAEAALAELQAGPKEQDVQTVQATLEQARIDLQTQRDSLSTAKTNAELQIDQAANMLRDAQDTYSQIYWDNRELENDLRNEELPQEKKNQEEAALRAVGTAEQHLEQAQLAYEEAAKAEITGIQTAEQAVVQAQAALDKLLLPTDADAIAAAESARAQAQAQLDRLFPNPTQAELNQAGAAIAQAQAQLETIRLDREYAELRAPFDGVVSIVNIDPGDHSGMSGEPVIQIIDISTVYVEVAISDIDIVHVTMGQAANIYPEALPDQKLTGQVGYIAPAATGSDTIRTYEVHITLDDFTGLQAGMSVRVELPIQKTE